MNKARNTARLYAETCYPERYMHAALQHLTWQAEELGMYEWGRDVKDGDE